MIIGNTVGAILKTPDTFIIVDEEGRELTAVSSGEEVDLNATANDIRKGLLAANNFGLVEGEKDIPDYYAYEGSRIITKGSKVTLPNINPEIDSYDYTKLQGIICLYNTNLSDSVAAEKVALLDKVYNVQSVDPISAITKNHSSKNIEFGIVNDSDITWVMRYFLYKEIE